MLLFKYNGKQWKNVSSEMGPVFHKDFAARGLAMGDFNNDGAVDALVLVEDAAPLLLRNNAAKGNHWLGVRLTGKKANIDAIGARITYRSGDFQRTRTIVGGGSYLSAHDPRVVLGIGSRTKLDWIEVKWPQPSGKTERITDLPIDRYITIVEGDGKWK
jgi:enediyne biosynthesis protein E4